MLKFFVAAVAAVIPFTAATHSDPPPTVYEVEAIVLDLADEICRAAEVMHEAPVHEIVADLMPDVSRVWPHLGDAEVDRTAALMRGIIVGCVTAYNLQ